MGLDIGLEKTGSYELLACLEKIPMFCETIRINRDAGRIGSNNTKVYEGDISDFDPEEIMKELKLKPGDIDLIVGGPPCQSFSTAGKRGTVQDPRGTLLWQYLKFIQVMQPKMFIMENVRGLMSAALNHRPIAERPEKGGKPLKHDEEPGSVVRRFVEDLNEEYRLDCFEVNSVNYGASQIRERAIFIGNRFNRVVDFPSPTHGPLDSSDDDQHSLLKNKTLIPYKTLGDALKGLKEKNPVVLDFSPRKKKFLSMIPSGGNWRCLPAEIAQESMGKAYFAKGGRSGWWRRLSFDLPSPTIVTMPNHSSTSLCHPIEVRALSLRECARVQGFPDSWEFAGKVSQQYAQVGNAVPTILGEVAGKVVALELAQIYKTKFKPLDTAAQLCRIVYLQSHVRTRQWFKDGEKVVWKDGKKNKNATYSSAKTLRKETVIEAH